MNYPRHIGIIPDGNRTRAKEKGLPSIMGHKAGATNAKQIIKYIFEETPIEIITVRGASTENINERKPEELKYLYKIYQTITKDMEKLSTKYGVGFKRIGSEIGLPTSLVSFFREQEQKYISKEGKYMILAVNYGGRDEIIRGIKTYVKTQGVKNIDELNEEILSENMDLGAFPLIELIIRSKGEVAKRLSGFMTRWIGYAELYFFEKYFPDFTLTELKKSLERFDQVVEHRNFGK